MLFSLYISTEAAFLKKINKQSDSICCKKEDWIKTGKEKYALEAMYMSLSNNTLGLKTIPEKAHLAIVSLIDWFLFISVHVLILE